MTDQVAETIFTQEATPVAQPATPADQQPVAQPVTPTPAPVFQVPEAAQGLVGEGKKYASPEDALVALPHAQSHIETLELEMVTLREDLAKRKAVEDVLEEINKKPTDTVTEPQFTPEQLDALIENKLIAKDAQAVAQSNISEVVNMFVQEFGDKEKAEAIYDQKAKELGLNVDYINNLAATSPKAVFRLFGMESKTQSTPTRLTSNVNSEAVINQAPATPAPASTVMGRSTHKDDMAAWRAAAPTE